MSVSLGALAPLGLPLFAFPALCQITLNEVLPAPGTDWTGNGIYSSQEDEWIEITNVGGSTVDLSGYLVTDSSGGLATPRIGLSGVLDPGDHLFLTGEHAVDWEVANGFPSVGLSLNNSGDTVYLFQVAGGTSTLVDSLAYTSGDVDPDVSLGKLPDGTGPWTAFDALMPGGVGPQPTPGGPNGGIASPKILSTAVSPSFPTDADSVGVEAVCADADGIAECLLLLRVDGGSQQQLAMTQTEGEVTHGTWSRSLGVWPAGTVLTFSVQVSDGTLLAATNDEDVVVAASFSPVALNEVLADPPADLAGDANGDGVRHTSDDEFVEIVNVGGVPLDLTGWTLHDASSPRHEFASGPVLDPGEMFVVFGGGSPTGIPSGADVASSGGLSLNNTGDEVHLRDDQGVSRSVLVYGSEANSDQSLIRVPDGTGDWTRPGDEGYSWAFSPGLPNTSSTTSLSETTWGAVKSLYRQ